MRKIGAVLAAALLLAACSRGGDGDRDAFCEAVKDRAEEVAGAAEDMLDNAPDAIKDALEALEELDPESDEAAYEEARTTVNTFIRNKCGLDFEV